MSLVNITPSLQQVPAAPACCGGGTWTRRMVPCLQPQDEGKLFEWLLLIGEVPQRNFLKHYITGKFSRD